eukprot:1394383-Amorphochlora_amoeboformis.AAC.1
MGEGENASVWRSEREESKMKGGRGDRENGRKMGKQWGGGKSEYIERKDRELRRWKTLEIEIKGTSSPAERVRFARRLLISPAGFRLASVEVGGRVWVRLGLRLWLGGDLLLRVKFVSLKASFSSRVPDLLASKPGTGILIERKLRINSTP